MATTIDREVLFGLIQSATSLGVVSDFLRRKQLHFSAGSWDDMFNHRLAPYLDDAAITIDELVDLLRTVEEYGRQHIFLFRTTAANAAGIIDRATVTARLRSLRLASLLTNPALYEHPEQPTISDVRWVQTNTGDEVELVVKEIQSREHYRLIGTREDGDRLTREYQRVRERGVNVVRVHRSGRIEMRIAARTGSARYREDLIAFRHRLERLIPMSHIAEVSLRAAKERLWTNRSHYVGKIRFSEVGARNDDDFILKASAGSLSANVSSNEASVTSMENFIGRDGRCESYNLWFSKEHTPSGRDVHFLLSGEVNEFAINASCTKEDYEYVLSEIRALNA